MYEVVMDQSNERKQYSVLFSDEVVHTFTNVASAASRLINEQHQSYNPLANYYLLRDEPAIARVVVLTENEELRTYYICRTTPVLGIVKFLASYHAPVGRLASLPLSAEHIVPDGLGKTIKVRVVENAKLRPYKEAGGWDSRDSVIQAEKFGLFTIQSLRKTLLDSTSLTTGTELVADIVASILEEEASNSNIFEGKRKSVITKMGLRDQPILDHFQDNIFRLPLNKRLLILGPPGTGKTTTLIRRISQKRDQEFLDDEEKKLIENIYSTSRNVISPIPHENSWLMFTPTELLKQYLKEAFAREGVPASDSRIRTWSDYRHSLARDTLGILKRSSGGGTFILKDGLNSLNIKAHNHPIDWFNDFNTWQRKLFVQEFQESLNILREFKATEVQNLCDRLGGSLKQLGDGKLVSTSNLVTIFVFLATESTKAQGIVKSLKESTDGKIKKELNIQINRNPNFLDELAYFIDKQQTTINIDADQQEDLDDEEEDDQNAPRTGRAAAVNAYMKAVRSKAKSAASKRTVNKSSPTGKILEWLEDRVLTGSELVDVGSNLVVQAHLRRFIDPVKRFLEGIPKRYRAFRRDRLYEGESWYANERFDAFSINPLELDLMLLTILLSTGDMLSRTNVLSNIRNSSWSALLPIFEQYRNQVYVDEATDFSPIQLACMAALANPLTRSFFACGDFNQRLTKWGARSTDEVLTMISNLEIRDIAVPYRQSKKLNDLTRAMISPNEGIQGDLTMLTQNDFPEVAPVLLEHASEINNLVNWIADRILEIERFIGQLPSIAIFVNIETEVSPVAEALNLKLAEHNIQVMACREGQSVGQDSNVRVFAIEHIKGLEFEAVFFLSVDELDSELFDKYLYVGATRAATYLGLTCKGKLPSAAESLRNHFGQDWQV